MSTQFGYHRRIRRWLNLFFPRADYLDSPSDFPMEAYQFPPHEKLASEYSCEDTWRNDAGKRDEAEPETVFPPEAALSGATVVLGAGASRCVVLRGHGVLGRRSGGQRGRSREHARRRRRHREHVARLGADVLRIVRAEGSSGEVVVVGPRRRHQSLRRGIRAVGERRRGSRANAVPVVRVRGRS